MYEASSSSRKKPQSKHSVTYAFTTNKNYEGLGALLWFHERKVTSRFFSIAFFKIVTVKYKRCGQVQTRPETTALRAETFQFGVAHEYTPAQLHKKLFFSAATCWPSTQWFQMSKIRQNISSPKVISRVFPWKFLQIHITSVSGCLRFTFKICQTVAGTSMIRRFHEFFESRFWRVFAILPNCVPSPPLLLFTL